MTHLAADLWAMPAVCPPQMAGANTAKGLDNP